MFGVGDLGQGEPYSIEALEKGIFTTLVKVCQKGTIVVLGPRYTGKYENEKGANPKLNLCSLSLRRRKCVSFHLRNDLYISIP